MSSKSEQIKTILKDYLCLGKTPECELYVILNELLDKIDELKSITNEYNKLPMTYASHLVQLKRLIEEL